MKERLVGGCLCGEIKFELEGDFKVFYQCHCKQCRQLTGTAFASNLFTNTENIRWTRGYDSLSKYEHPTRSFSKAFCCVCGSALPFVNKSQSALIVPAGSLESEISPVPSANIFYDERACWLESGQNAPKKPSFP